MIFCTDRDAVGCAVNRYRGAGTGSLGHALGAADEPSSPFAWLAVIEVLESTL